MHPLLEVLEIKIELSLSAGRLAAEPSTVTAVGASAVRRKPCPGGVPAAARGGSALTCLVGLGETLLMRYRNLCGEPAIH